MFVAKENIQERSDFSFIQRKRLGFCCWFAMIKLHITGDPYHFFHWIFSWDFISADYFMVQDRSIHLQVKDILIEDPNVPPVNSPVIFLW
ncbi:hypothetical protein L1987_84000 [Smallanthus sonchifolius]|uniref:Uncharacterized protein n=1 Tax=Smallanthus sonchifolius TaxID=185202 RepID=A0ACB8YHQ1_9ASTR|nr:hypothetical protein L1987_84000 [Smallanthus sonchifolius]